MNDTAYYGHLRRGPYVASSGTSDAGVFDDHGMTAEIGGPGVSITAEIGWDYAHSDHIRIVLTENSSGRDLVLFEGSESDFKALLAAPR